MNSRTGDGYFHWKKIGSQFSDEIRNAWSLNIDLVTENNRRMGSMRVYRVYNARPLQLDVNLLTTDFPPVLAEALARALAHNLDLVMGQAQAELRAAQAG